METSHSSGFQRHDNHYFISVPPKEVRSRRRKLPKYRRINKYFKSTKQYWKERNRRKQAWELSGQGLTYKQVAKTLGVSEKTIQRDLARIRPYCVKLSRKWLRELKQKRIAGIKAELEGKTPAQQYRILIEKMTDYRFLMKQREYKRHIVKIIINMDDLIDGFPAIRFWPKLPTTVHAHPHYFQFHVQRDGAQFYLGEIALR